MAQRNQSVLSGKKTQSKHGYVERFFRVTPTRNAVFITKLYSMVDDDETKDLITWTGSGDQFTVFNNVDFSRTVLPRYFKHCNWSSFVRQLNMYDFHKINDQTEDDTFNGNNNNGTENMVQRWDFKHPWFTKAGYDRLHKIRRKPPRNRLIPQMRYSNAMELIDEGPDADPEDSPMPATTSAPSPLTSQSAPNSASSTSQLPMKSEGVQFFISQLHDTTRNFESKLDYACNEILYLRSLVDKQQMVLNELYNSVEYLKSKQIQKEAGNTSSDPDSSKESRKPRKIHELLGMNHEYLQEQQQQLNQQIVFDKHDGGEHLEEDIDSSDRRRRRTQTEK